MGRGLPLEVGPSEGPTSKGREGIGGKGRGKGEGGRVEGGSVVLLEGDWRPWPLTPQQLSIRFIAVDHFCQFAAKLVHPFSKCQVHKICILRMNRQIRTLYLQAWSKTDTHYQQSQLSTSTCTTFCMFLPKCNNYHVHHITCWKCKSNLH